MTESVNFADVIACVSSTTETGLREYVTKHYPWRVLGKDDGFHFPLGSSNLVKGIAPRLRNSTRPERFLAVGTIEPRKRYDLIISAFEEVWKRYPEVSLTVVGRPGWKTEWLCEKLERLDASNTQFTWLSDAADEELARQYGETDCLIAASDQEGFGLPLVEAMSVGVPVIASDIEIFHEVAGDNALFFKRGDASDLAQLISSVIESAAVLPEVKVEERIFSWADSAEEFLGGLDRCGYPKLPLRRDYDYRVGRVLDVLNDRTAPPSQMVGQQPERQRVTDELVGMLRPIYARLSHDHYFGYPFRLARAILKSSNTRRQVFELAARLDELVNRVEESHNRIGALQSKIEEVEVRLGSLVALEHEHSEAAISALLSSIERVRSEEFSG